jgi:hypothetical protein
MSVIRFAILALAALCLFALLGCNKSSQQTPVAISTPATPSDYSARLNDPNVSEYEKEQIRKQQAGMGGAAAASTTFANPAPGAGGQ